MFNSNFWFYNTNEDSAIQAYPPNGVPEDPPQITFSSLNNCGVGTYFGDIVIKNCGDYSGKIEANYFYANNNVFIDNKLEVNNEAYFNSTISVNGKSDFNDKVGIGTTNPSYLLTVTGGDISVGTDNNHGLILTSPNGSKYRITVTNGGSLNTTLVL